jgi:hypothetical protein
MAEIGKAGARDQANIAGSNHCDAHISLQRFDGPPEIGDFRDAVATMIFGLRRSVTLFKPYVQCDGAFAAGRTKIDETTCKAWCGAMRIFITGTAGLIGYHLARRLPAKGHDVTSFDGMTPCCDVAAFVKWRWEFYAGVPLLAPE